MKPPPISQCLKKRKRKRLALRWNFSTLSFTSARIGISFAIGRIDRFFPCYQRLRCAEQLSKSLSSLLCLSTVTAIFDMNSHSQPRKRQICASWSYPYFTDTLSMFVQDDNTYFPLLLKRIEVFRGMVKLRSH